jgi:hypothetical protein
MAGESYYGAGAAVQAPAVPGSARRTTATTSSGMRRLDKVKIKEDPSVSGKMKGKIVSDIELEDLEEEGSGEAFVKIHHPDKVRGLLFSSVRVMGA